MAAPSIQALLQTAFDAHRNGRLDAAAQAYAAVRRAAPGTFEAWHLSGLVELQKNKPRIAVDLLARARGLNPRHALCAMRHGIALLALGRLPPAVASLRVAVELDEKCPEAWFHLGCAQADSRQKTEAVQAWKNALELQPDYAEVNDRWGNLVLATEGPAAAITHFRAATTAKPDWPQAWCNLGIALVNTGEHAAARAALTRALALAPGLGKARTALGLLEQQTYRIPEAAETFASALKINPHDHEARSGYLLTLNYLDRMSAAELAAAHRAFGDTIARHAPPQGTGRHQHKARLHLAFLSPDLRRHSVAYFLLPLLKHLDRTKFRVTLYHDHAIEDDVSTQLKTRADTWSNLHGQSDNEVAKQIRSDAPDVLIDLAGHTGINRLAVFARRVAPLQINYLGYPNTTGLHTMDYRFVDIVTDPPSVGDALASETLVRFAPTAWAYQPPATAPTVSAPPATQGAPVTFGSFNNFAKVSTRTIKTWSRILQATPGSRLLLKSLDLDLPDIAQRVSRLFADHGIAADRLNLRGRTKGLAEHLALYEEVDIALDPFPYHGTTTTCEALWMGRPVITLAGDRHASRVGVSLLTAIAHPDWIAADEDAYVRAAVSLAGNPSRLGSIATQLRTDLQNSDLLDHPAQAKRFGDAILRCWNDRDDLALPSPLTLTAV